jgi:hypothetical protein
MTTDLSPLPVWPRLQAAFTPLIRPFPAEAIALAEAHREEVVPHLVAALERVVAAPAAVDPDEMLHLYAAHLLAWWREPRGFQPLRHVAQMRDHELQYDLWGDFLTESLGRCLASMAHGDMQSLMGVAEDTLVDPYTRSAALTAMKVGVLEGDVPIDAMVAYGRDLAERVAAQLRSGEASTQGNDLFLALVIVFLMELGGPELLPAIRGWYAQDLVDASMVTLSNVEEALAQPLAFRLQELREEVNGYMGAPGLEFGCWACFQAPSEDSDKRAAPDLAAMAKRLLQQGPVPGGQPFAHETPKLGRNDPCHCGSGKKFKKCHGAA